MTAKDLLAKTRLEIEARMPGAKVSFGIIVRVDDAIGFDSDCFASIDWMVFAQRGTKAGGISYGEGRGPTADDALERFLHGPLSIDRIAGADDKALAKIDV